MKLFSYVVARDFGFAPNPFGGYCTLATCKPQIRQQANVGDWIAGIASKADSKTPKLVYVMRVDEVLTYDLYWRDERFSQKKPMRQGSVKRLFGDNIYHKDDKNSWIQEDSHHSCADGSPNQRNIDNDTKSSGVLVSQHFAYWGSNAVNLPQQFVDFNGETILLQRGYRNNFTEEFISAFIAWFEGYGAEGFLGSPFQWERPRATWSRPS